MMLTLAAIVAQSRVYLHLMPLFVEVGESQFVLANLGHRLEFLLLFCVATFALLLIVSSRREVLKGTLDSGRSRLAHSCRKSFLKHWRNRFGHVDTVGLFRG